MPISSDRLQTTDSDFTSPEACAQRLRSAIADYRTPIRWHALGQIANTFIPFVALWALAYWSLSLSYWMVLLLAIPAAGLVVRIFIIQHDCGHGSFFFRSRRANDGLGLLCSLVTFAPYAHWRRQHAGHHRNWNNLDRRLSGADFYSTCLTVAEYRALTRWARWRYRVLQHPLVALILLPPLIFLVLYRVPFDTPPSWRKERRAVWLTDAALAGLFTMLGLALGFREVLMVEGPIIIYASIIGVWLFSLQHRFEKVLWSRAASWNPVTASLHGSSFLQLPRVLQWFTGNIGFHHVHHLDTLVPNYRLAERHAADPEMQAAPVLTLRSGLSALRYCLWDEEAGRMLRLSSVGRPGPVGTPRFARRSVWRCHISTEVTETPHLLVLPISSGR